MRSPSVVIFAQAPATAVFAKMIFRRIPRVLAILSFGCAAAPRPTAASVALARNPRATIEGRLLDRNGRPVAGSGVQALPRGRDIGWSPGAVTDPEGRFRLSVFAPAEYGFLLSWHGRTVVTPEAQDPARLSVRVAPGERREGVALVFLQNSWERVP
jgi:hypothetical protein